jgi:hypothetical protein
MIMRPMADDDNGDWFIESRRERKLEFLVPFFPLFTAEQEGRRRAGGGRGSVEPGGREDGDGLASSWHREVL